METNEYDNFSPYQKLMEGLKNNYKGLESGANTVFQFLPAPMDASWDTAMDYEIYQKMDAVPAERGIYYVPGSSAVSTAYPDMLDTLEESNCLKNTQYAKLQASLENKYSLQRTQLAPLRKVYMAEEHITENTFKTRNFLAWVEECAEIGDPDALRYQKTQDREINKIQDAMSEIERKLAAPYKRAQNNVKNNLIEYKDRLGTSFSLPYCSIDGEINRKIDQWDKSMEDDYEMTTVMKENRTIAGDWESLYSSSFTAKWYGGSLDASAELTRLLTNATYEVTLKVKGIETFKINRGKWYNDDYVKPDMPFVEGTSFKPAHFFGASGSLQHIPLSFLVIYKPTIELKIDKKVYQERIYNNTHLGPSLFFFGLPFDISGGIEKHRVVSPDDHVVLTFKPTTTDKPKIIGVTSAKKYLG